MGTRFSVDAAPARTILAVREGLVRLKRLTDGIVVDFPAYCLITDQDLGLAVTSIELLPP